MQNLDLNRRFLVLATTVMLCSAAEPTSTWRDAFQSSPATYEPPSDSFLKFAAERARVPVETLRVHMTPQSVDGTIRYRVMVQAAGSQLRVRLSNEEGEHPISIRQASVGLAADGFAARPNSLIPLTFSGASAADITVGAPILSDPIRLPVQPGTAVIVSIALSAPIERDGRGGAGFAQSHGDQTMRAVMDRPTLLTGRPLVSGISVLSDPAPNVVVALGDSITDGNRSAPDMSHGWPEQLANRLTSRKTGGRYVVVNAGIAGNRLLAKGWGAAGLARLDRDALRIPGISHIVLLEGVNDINFSGHGIFGDNPEITARDLINGYRQVIARAHARGVKVYLGTLTPYPKDATTTAAKAEIRDRVNQWIRTAREADAVIDFDRFVRDPAAPTKFLQSYDSGDHLHPSDAGYKAMGQGIDLSLFP